MRLNLLVAALAVIASVLAVHAAQANFGAAQGFSGRSGATCVACHLVEAVPQPAATAILEGLPTDGWTPGETYLLAMRVEGGPQEMPAPQPRGGFDIAANAGRFSIVPGTEALMRPIDDLEVSYTAEGTQVRQWEVAWSAPDLSQLPRPAQIWLAVIAANGNHVIAAGLADGGERLDSADNLTVIVPPSDAAWAAWRALPLVAPEVNGTLTERDALVEGRHVDANATTLAWRVDGGAWQSRETAASFRLALPGLSPGHHTVELRSEGAQRASPAATASFDVPGILGPLTRDSPSLPPPILVLLVGALAVLVRKSLP